MRWVIKVGSALATDNGRGLKLDAFDAWVDQSKSLIDRGEEVLFVTSGAVAAGVARLGWRQRPSALHEMQAAAAVGQMGLVQAFESRFSQFGLATAQVLLTHEDLSDRNRYLNARGVLRQLLELGVVPVINENDTVTVDELRFGDNDTLAGLVCNLVEADRLVLLTDQQGLLSADPRVNPEARLITEGRAGDPALEAMAGEGGALGRGGMRSKLRAAVYAARSGTITHIAHGKEQGILVRLLDGERIGTRLLPSEEPLAARKRWLAGKLHPRGQVTVDAGAAAVLRRSGSSLLPVGVVAAEGQFQRGDLVVCLDHGGAEVARGLVNYDRDEVDRIKGLPSRDIERALGYAYEAELIHRDNMVVSGGAGEAEAR